MSTALGTCVLSILFCGAILNQGASTEAPPSPSGTWILTFNENRFTFPEDVEVVDLISRFDGRRLTIEDRFSGSTSARERPSCGALVFIPPIAPELGAPFCQAIFEKTSPQTERIALTNGDAFEGRLVRIDLRFVYFSAFGRELKIPRGRVRVVSWKTAPAAE